MDKYLKGILFIAIITPFVATIVGTIFPEPAELIPLSGFIVIAASVFFIGMIIGIKEGTNKK